MSAIATDSDTSCSDQAFASMWNQLRCASSNAARPGDAVAPLDMATPSLFRRVEAQLRQYVSAPKARTEKLLGSTGKRRTSSKQENARRHAELQQLYEFSIAQSSEFLEQSGADRLMAEIRALQPALERDQRGRSKGGATAKQPYKKIWAFAVALAREKRPSGGWPSCLAAAREVHEAVLHYSEASGIELKSSEENLVKTIAKHLSKERDLVASRKNRAPLLCSRPANKRPD